MTLRDRVLTSLRVCKYSVRRWKSALPHFFVIDAPDGNYTVFMPDTDPDKRKQVLRAVRSFMIWKAATSFVFGTEDADPPAIRAAGISRCETIGLLQRYRELPLRFEPPEWFGREGIEADILGLLPPRQVTSTADEFNLIQALEQGQKLPDFHVGNWLTQSFTAQMETVKRYRAKGGAQ